MDRTNEKKWDIIIEQGNGNDVGTPVPLRVETLGKSALNVVQVSIHGTAQWISVNREGARKLRDFIDRFLKCDYPGCQIAVPHEHCTSCGTAHPSRIEDKKGV